MCHHTSAKAYVPVEGMRDIGTSGITVRERGPGALRLTERQFDVLRLLAKGKSNKAIAAELGIGVDMVKEHTSNIFRRLGVENRAAAAVKLAQSDS